MLSIAAALLLIGASRLVHPCTPVPGAAQLWSQTGVRWLWVGEVHGTTETPALFGDLVCDALAHGRHVTVALERPSTEQAAIDAIVASADRNSAQQALLNQTDWRVAFDGRTSQAMLALLFELHDLKAEYPSLRVVAAVDPAAFASGPKANDEAMGKAILALGGKQPQDLVLVLTGNVHGLKNAMFGSDSAAMYLPGKEVTTLQVTDAGGQAWTLTPKGCGAARGGIPDKDKTRPFGVYLDPTLARVGAVDGIVALGKPTTASPPANGAAVAAAPCREAFLAAHKSPTP